ncbi:carboxymuconolactone decarboxylase family protein [Eleftheria terrae]|uniref:carboxymuconolactone decarboxylase family protein n=1 Tax=Eleftheria terrae TaxID=1597781 RepID=UPI00263BC4A2|nr:carboxymuconolactone decarboxylase family protein [Eleftheria terrae]WKB50708.1 carboxymuconolactone decarboxylase family protein [Eleftheria terrae]
MNHYQSPDDLRLSGELARLAPVEAKAFLAFDHAAKRAGGQLEPKVRELISVAVALTTQCGYCLDVHTRAAKRLGCSREELAEVALVAAAVRAGATLGHGLLALRLFDEAPG